MPVLPPAPWLQPTPPVLPSATASPSDLLSGFLDRMREGQATGANRGNELLDMARGSAAGIGEAGGRGGAVAAGAGSELADRTRRLLAIVAKAK